MSRLPATIEAHYETVTVDRGELAVEVCLRPFAFTLARAGRELLRRGTVWASEGVVHDHFIALTEGVVAHEDLLEPELAKRARVRRELEDGLELAVKLRSGRQVGLVIRIPDERTAVITLSTTDQPLRLAIEWQGPEVERFVGLGARHGTTVDQAGRTVQLGADRRYTGPDCPADLLAGGGIPQGDCAPVPWLLSSGGYAVWIRTEANGTRLELGPRTSVSTRADAGPLEAVFLCDRGAAARLGHFCRLTGRPALLPEWGYGFWKSRDVYEHQDDALDDFQGFAAHDIPLDAIVIDSPWETQYNTWRFNPHQFPDPRGMIARMRSRGVRTVVWVTPWVNLDSRDGQIPPQPGSERLHAQPASNYAAGAAAGHFVRGADGEPMVAQWWMGTGSPVDFTSPAAESWWRAQAKQLLELGVEGIKADDGEGYYIPDHVRLADGRTGAQAAWALGGLHRLSVQRALDEVHPGRGVLFGRSGWDRPAGRRPHLGRRPGV